MKPPYLSPTTLLLLTSCLWSTFAVAQKLPAASRTVYKCEVGGKIQYSDEPCLGATRVDVEPTRGLDKSTGRVQRGVDVQNERFREHIAESAKPLTGMNTQEFEQASRRQRLNAQAQHQCRSWDQQIPAAEAAERAAKTGEELRAAQQRLFELRSAYRKLSCD